MTLFNVLVGKTYMAIKSNPVSLFFPFCCSFHWESGKAYFTFWLSKRRTCPKAWWQLCLHFSFLFRIYDTLSSSHLSALLLSEILGDLKYTTTLCTGEGKTGSGLLFVLCLTFLARIAVGLNPTIYLGLYGMNFSYILCTQAERWCLWMPGYCFGDSWLPPGPNPCS